MRVTALTASLFLGAAIISIPGQTAQANTAKVTCLCDCPADHKVLPRHHALQPTLPRRAVRHSVRRYAEGGYYSYRMAAPIYQREWHGPWRAAPNDAYIPPGPAPYYAPPPMAYAEPEGLVIDQRGWSGGVGNEEGGGGGGGGYGQVLLTSGANSQNGPSYNSYDESFQENPSVPGPFRNRLRGGFAPPSAGSGSGSK